MDKKFFNVENRGLEAPTSMFFVQEKGLFDTINKNFPEVWKVYKEMKSLDWDENEFNFSSCYSDFKSCDPVIKDMMIETLAWQWEADSVAAHNISSIVNCFSPAQEVFTAWGRITDNEGLHGATYSEIVRSSFDNPEQVMSEILDNIESLQRLSTVGECMQDAFIRGHELMCGREPTDEDYDAILMFVAALYCLERIQFIASFAITFNIADTGLFQPIGKAVQKIAQDELEVHCKMDRLVLENELNTEKGKKALKRIKPKLDKLVKEIINSELGWTGHMFRDGRELLGLNKPMLDSFVLYNGEPVLSFFHIEHDYDIPEKNPLKYMDRWLDIGKTQPSPQEQDIGMYKMNVVNNDLDDLGDFEL